MSGSGVSRPSLNQASVERRNMNQTFGRPGRGGLRQVICCFRKGNNGE